MRREVGSSGRTDITMQLLIERLDDRKSKVQRQRVREVDVKDKVPQYKEREIERKKKGGGWR